MARLFAGEKECKTDDLIRLLRAHGNGLREQEIAESLRWDRRSVNNYLRDLQTQELAYKEGRLWFVEG